MEKPDSSRDIDAETLRKWMEAGRPLTVLDVRPPGQRAEWAIPGSIHADVYAALKAGDTGALRAWNFPEGVPVVTVCGLGRTSKQAADILARTGIQAYSLTGGMQAWSLAWNAAGLPLSLPGAELIQVRRVGKGCLSYLLLSKGEAAVIDPSVEPDVYLGLAQEKGARIKVVLDTHVHADHFSRTRALAGKAGIEPSILHEGDTLALGDLRLEVWETPGHTPDSRSFVLPGQAVFTGDTLFLDSVGRPDLIAGLDPAQQSELLFASIGRLSTLPDSTWVLPAHVPFPPAFDGIPLAATLGELKVRNKYLAASKGDFLAMVLAGRNAPPPHFETIVEANRSGAMPAGDWASLEAGPNRCARA